MSKTPPPPPKKPDPKCQELARYLIGEPIVREDHRRIYSLTATIQAAVADWFKKETP